MRYASALTTTIRACWQHWYQFWTVYRCLERRANLERLIAWAERKRLPGPLKLYRSRVADEELRLMHHAIRSRLISNSARRFFWVCKVLNPPRRTYAKGSAARYRRPQPRKIRSAFRFSF